MPDALTVRTPTITAPGQGRAYSMGRLRAVFKADGEETQGRYSVSEWWLEPRTRGPGVHQHGDDHVFYVIAGTLSVRVRDDWSDAPSGTCILIPGGAPHDFENRSAAPAGFIAFNAPGGFEADMPDIAEALCAEDLRL